MTSVLKSFIHEELAYEFGKQAAEDGDPFCPELTFFSAGQMGMYAQGFLSVKPDNAAALSFVGNVAERGVETVLYTYSEADVLPSLQPAAKNQAHAEMTEQMTEYLRSLDLAADEAQYTPRPGYDF